MNLGHATPIRRNAIIGSLTLLLCLGASAQTLPAGPQATPAPPAHRTVALVSDACPVVHPGDFATLDWNPGFDPDGDVTGLRTASLSFAGLEEDGITIRSRPSFVLGGRGAAVVASPIGNGYFHIEVAVFPRLHPGVYHLIGAQATPTLFPEYQGPTPRMTVSPVSQRFCITVVSSR